MVAAGLLEYLTNRALKVFIHDDVRGVVSGLAAEIFGGDFDTVIVGHFLGSNEFGRRVVICFGGFGLVLAVPHGHTSHESDNDDHESHGDQIALTTVVALAVLAHFFGAFVAMLSLVDHSTSPTGTTADHMPHWCLVSE